MHQRPQIRSQSQSYFKSLIHQLSPLLNERHHGPRDHHPRDKNSHRGQPLSPQSNKLTNSRLDPKIKAHAQNFPHRHWWSSQEDVSLRDKLIFGEKIRIGIFYRCVWEQF